VCTLEAEAEATLNNTTAIQAPARSSTATPPACGVCALLFVAQAETN